MSGNIIKLVLQSAADTSGFKIVSGALRGLIGGLAKIGGAARGAFSKLGGFAAGIGRNLMNIKAGFEMAAGAIRGILSNMGKAFKFETQTVQFKTLIGSIDEAKAHMQMLQELGNTPPFSLDQFAAASRSLMVMTDGALGYRQSLELVGDAAAATGQPIESLAHVVGRAYAVIRDGQPISRATMALRNMGVLTPEVAAKMDEMQKAGASNVKIWNELQTALGRYSGAMKETEQTGEGLIGAISSQWDNTVRDFGTAFMDVVKGGLSRVLDKMRELREDGSIAVWADKAGKALSQFVVKAEETANVVSKVLDFLWNKSGVSDVWHGFNSLVQGSANAIGTAFGGGTLKDVWGSFKESAVEELAKGHYARKLMENGTIGGETVERELEALRTQEAEAKKMEETIRKNAVSERAKAAKEAAKIEAAERVKENTRITNQLAKSQAKKDAEETRKIEDAERKDRLQKDKAANTERANDLRDKLKRAQNDAKTAAGQFASLLPGSANYGQDTIDQAAERKNARQEEINRVRLANRAIDLQARNPNWRNARNLSRQDEAARRWLLAKENEGKQKNELKDAVDKLANIEKLLEKATTL